MTNLRRLPRLALLCALFTSACEGGGEERALSRLESLVFVPARSCVLLPETKTPVDCSNEVALLVDRFEVTQAQWMRWLDGLDSDALARSCTDFWQSRAPSKPATGMTLDEAREFAAGEGMRVPTGREWLRVAVGTRAQYFPWGRLPAESVANTLELELGDLAPVGTFENGRTPSGVYDLLGNAREWTIIESLLPPEEASSQRAWAIGGSYLSNKSATYLLDEGADLDNDGQIDGNTSFNAILLDPGLRGRDVGLRLIADAEDWLRAASKTWSAESLTEERLERVGRSWGSASIPLLERLVREPGAAPALEYLLRGARR